MPLDRIYEIFEGSVFLSGGLLCILMRFRVTRRKAKLRNPKEDGAWFTKNDWWIRIVGPFLVIAGIFRMVPAL